MNVDEVVARTELSHRHVLGCLGLEGVSVPPPPSERLADEATEERAARFLRECGESGA